MKEIVYCDIYDFVERVIALTTKKVDVVSILEFDLEISKKMCHTNLYSFWDTRTKFIRFTSIFGQTAS